jgi:hypothetical protein
MKLMFASEYWREELAGAIDTAEGAAGVTLDHLRWVIRGKVSEIVAWAEQIRRDSE